MSEKLVIKITESIDNDWSFDDGRQFRDFFVTFTFSGGSFRRPEPFRMVEATGIVPDGKITHVVKVGEGTGLATAMTLVDWLREETTSVCNARENAGD